MDTPIKSKLERWIRQQVFLVDEDRGRCRKIILRHVAGGRVGSDLLTISVPKKADDAWLSEILGEIDSRVVDDAEGLGGVQTYVIHPFFENRPDKPGSRFTIRETASEENLDDVESEPPTKTGLITQMMRHTEAAHRVSLMATGQIISTLRQTVGRQQETIEKLTSEKMENLAVMEKLKSEELERRLTLQAAETEERRRSEMFDKLSAMIPVVANRLAGRKLLPEKASPTEGMVKSLMDSLDSDQMERLGQILRPEQMMLVLEAFQASQPGPNGATKQQGE